MRWAGGLPLSSPELRRKERARRDTEEPEAWPPASGRTRSEASSSSSSAGHRSLRLRLGPVEVLYSRR